MILWSVTLRKVDLLHRQVSEQLRQLSVKMNETEWQTNENDTKAMQVVSSTASWILLKLMLEDSDHGWFSDTPFNVLHWLQQCHYLGGKNSLSKAMDDETRCEEALWSQATEMLRRHLTFFSLKVSLEEFQPSNVPWTVTPESPATEEDPGQFGPEACLWVDLNDLDLMT